MTKEQLEQANKLWKQIDELKRMLGYDTLYVWNGIYRGQCGHLSYTNEEINICIRDLIEIELQKKEEEFKRL